MGRSDRNKIDYNGKRDELGREMTELVTVELERGEWWFIHNQLRNMGYEWRRTNAHYMSRRCDDIADEIGQQWYREGTVLDANNEATGT